MSKVEMMDSVKTWKEFKEIYGFWDDEQIYTNCAMLIPVFRVEQWLDQINESHVRPLPCVRVGRKAIKNYTDKEHFAKIDEELNELKEEVILYSSSDYGNLERIAEEAADVKTAITTLEEALCIGAKMRDEAQRRVNERNRERGRL